MGELRRTEMQNAEKWFFFIPPQEQNKSTLSNLGEAIERDNNEFAIEEFGRGATVLRNRLSLSNAKTADVTVWYNNPGQAYFLCISVMLIVNYTVLRNVAPRGDELSFLTNIARNLFIGSGHWI